MTVGEFNALEIERREELIWNWAFLIAGKNEGDHNLFFYAFSGFVVGLELNTFNNDPENIRAITKEEFLEQYRDIVASVKNTAWKKFLLYRQEQKN
jgi:hypothetical protein